MKHRKNKGHGHKAPARPGGFKKPERAPKPHTAKDAAPHKKAPRLNIDLFGTHAVRAAWDNPSRFIHALFITDAALKDFPLTSPAKKRPAPTIIAKDDLDRALPLGTVHQGIALSCQPLEELGVQDLLISGTRAPRSLLLMLDQVTDPHNVGAILRSACAFGAGGVIMQSRHAPELQNGILAKTACGAVEHVPVAYETNLSRALESLKDAGYFIIGLDERGEDISTLRAPEKAVLVLGAEGAGLRRLVKENCDVLARLPMTGPMPSINVSNAAAVALYALGTMHL